MTQPPDPKPSLNDQIADILLKVLMTGGIAGGGLGAFWSLFKDSDVPKAIASFVIQITLLAIAYLAPQIPDFLKKPGICHPGVADVKVRSLDLFALPLVVQPN